MTAKSMPDDDFYVNDGETFQAGIYYPDQPAERTEEEHDEVAPIVGSYPIMPAVADWFTEQIAACDSISNVQTQTFTINGVTVDRKVGIEAQVLAYQLLKELLSTKLEEFSEFATEHEDE